MNYQAIFTVIGVIISGYLTYLATRGKTDVDATNAKVGGEKTTSDMYREFGMDMELRFDKLQEKFDILSAKFDTMKDEKELLARASLVKDTRIKALEDKVDAQAVTIEELRMEVEKYKGAASPEHLAQVAHEVIDQIKDQTINNQQ